MKENKVIQQFKDINFRKLLRKNEIIKISRENKEDIIINEYVKKDSIKNFIKRFSNYEVIDMGPKECWYDAYYKFYLITLGKESKHNE